MLHTTAGYLLHSAFSHRVIFDCHDNDIYWCTADIGWVTGHSYIVYGPLANGATTLMFEGVPTYPDAGRFWQIVAKHKVTIFYTAPTAIRSLMREGEQWPNKHDLSSLRILGSVGEPINPEAWLWYHRNIGKGKCPIVDTWWQTETGGILITPLPGRPHPEAGQRLAALLRRGTRCRARRREAMRRQRGRQALHQEALARHGAHHVGRPRALHRHLFRPFQDLYYTGDGCRVDQDGDYWLMGRVDDVVNISGHRIGTAEVESALVSHPKVSEAAVVGYPARHQGLGPLRLRDRQGRRRWPRRN